MCNNCNKHYFVTTALPYANNDLHIGHMLEHTQADIWVRYLRMLGKDVSFICGDDAHGTPIMLRSELLGIQPQELVASFHNINKEVFKEFAISFDHYGSTHSQVQTEQTHLVYQKLQQAGVIVEREIEQFYDVEKGMFLPDRYIKGTCPKCKAQDQYGDNCEVCSSIYTPVDLINPYSALTGTRPELRKSNHFFFDLPKFEASLKNWCENGSLSSEVYNKLKEWFTSGLQQWDISRDAPYFGIEIPNQPGKYFYVWLDAPIGYLSFFKEYCRKVGKDFDKLVSADNDTSEMYHFIGKDIMYFHSLFWPAMLEGANYRKPQNIFVHGYVTVNGVKMSKSRGTFIKAKTWAKFLPSQALRYYYAAKLGSSITDVDLNLEDFISRVNADLVNKYVNLASRSASFIKKFFANQLSTELDNKQAYEQFIAKANEVGEFYNTLNYSKAIRDIAALADEANKYFNDREPWIIAKDESRKQELHNVVTQTLAYFRAIMIMLKPVIPQVAAKAEQFLNEEFTWSSLEESILGKQINDFVPMFQRLESVQVEQLIETSKQEAAQEKALNEKLQQQNGANVKPQLSAQELEDKIAQGKAKELDEYVTIDDFAKLDLRVATVLACNEVKGSNKLLQFKLDLGDGEVRNVFSGIKADYQNPEQLVGMQVVMVYNLAPRKMSFGMSEGMILSAKDSNGLKLLTVVGDVEPGSKVA